MALAFQDTVRDTVHDFSIKKDELPSQRLRDIQIREPWIDILKEALPDGYKIKKNDIESYEKHAYSYSLLSNNRIKRHLIYLPADIIEERSPDCINAVQAIWILFWQNFGKNNTLYMIHGGETDAYWDERANGWFDLAQITTHYIPLSKIEEIALFPQERKEKYVMTTFDLEKIVQKKLTYEDLDTPEYDIFINVLTNLTEFTEDMRTFVEVRSGLTKLSLSITYGRSEQNIASQIIRELRKLDEMPGHDGYHPLGLLFQRIINHFNVPVKDKKEIQKILSKFNLIPGG